MFGDVAGYFAHGDAALYAVFLGLVVPWFVALFNRPSFKSGVGTLLVALFSVLAAVGDLYFNGQLVGHKVASTALVVAVASVVFYKNAFKRRADALEAATTPKPKAALPAAEGEVQEGQVDPTDGE